MRKLTSIAVFSLAAVASTSVLAKGYVGLGVGVNSVDAALETTYSGGRTGENTPYPLKTISPDGSGEVSGSVFAGFFLTESLAVELGYSNFRSENSIEEMLPVGGGPAEEMEWEASLDAHQFVMMPVYFLPLDEKLSLKAGIGLTYTDYNYRSYRHYETWNQEGIKERDDRPESGIGGKAQVGFNYSLNEQIGFGIYGSYAMDSHVNNADAGAVLTYSF